MSTLSWADSASSVPKLQGNVLPIALADISAPIRSFALDRLTRRGRPGGIFRLRLLHFGLFQLGGEFISLLWIREGRHLLSWDLQGPVTIGSHDQRSVQRRSRVDGLVYPVLAVLRGERTAACAAVQPALPEPCLLVGRGPSFGQIMEIRCDLRPLWICGF